MAQASYLESGDEDSVAGRTWLGGFVWGSLRFIANSGVLFVETLYRTFKVSVLGVWNDSDWEFFDVQRKENIFLCNLGEGNLPDNYSRFLQSLIGSRVIIFLILPYSSIIVPLAILTSAYPIFISRSPLASKLSPLVSTYLIQTAEVRLRATCHSLSRWAVRFKACEIFVSESRLIQYIYNFSLGIIIAGVVVLDEAWLPTLIPFSSIVIIVVLVQSTSVVLGASVIMDSLTDGCSYSSTSRDSNLSYRGVSLHEVGTDEDVDSTENLLSRTII
jgi:hypothetical protein